MLRSGFAILKEILGKPRPGTFATATLFRCDGCVSSMASTRRRRTCPNGGSPRKGTRRGRRSSEGRDFEVGGEVSAALQAPSNKGLGQSLTRPFHARTD